MGMNPKLGLLVGSISNPRVGGERFVCKQKVTYCKLAPELGSVQKERDVATPECSVPWTATDFSVQRITPPCRFLMKKSPLPSVLRRLNLGRSPTRSLISAGG